MRRVIEQPSAERLKSIRDLVAAATASRRRAEIS
jgi:hypothetical protein